MHKMLLPFFVFQCTDGINALITRKNILRIITDSYVETILHNTIKSSGKVCISKDALEPCSIFFLLGIADTFTHQRENWVYTEE